MKEKIENPTPSVTANELMDYLEEQLEKCHFRPDDMDKILNGLWIEKTSCTVRNCLMFDGIQGARIVHHEAVDVFYQILVLMKENDLALENLVFEISPPELPYPEIIFSVRTKEHLYEYYPIMLRSHYCSEKDEYIQIKNVITRLKTVYCDSNHTPEENY